MILYHAFYVQSFQRDSLVLADKFKRELMLEISSLIANSFMDF